MVGPPTTIGWIAIKFCRGSEGINATDISYPLTRGVVLGAGQPVGDALQQPASRGD